MGKGQTLVAKEVLKFFMKLPENMEVVSVESLGSGPYFTMIVESPDLPVSGKDAPIPEYTFTYRNENGKDYFVKAERID